MAVASPCVACCKLNDDEVCTGCYRSLAEIANWRVLTEPQRQQAVDNAAARKVEYLHHQGQHSITRAKCLAAQDPELWGSYYAKHS